MKKLLLLTVILMAVSAVVSASPLPCLGSTTLADLMTAGSCTSQGVTFSNFTYTGSVATSAVLATLVSSAGGTTYADGWSFGPAHGWTTGFTLGFTVSVTPTNALGVTAITNTVDQIFAGIVGPTNLIAASDMETAAVSPNPLTMAATTVGGETAQSNPYALALVDTSTIVNVPGGNLSNYEQVFYSTSIPEPVTFVLIGSSLVGLAFLRRRLHKG